MTGLLHTLFSQVTESEIKWSMSRLPVFQRMLDAACMAAAAGAEQAVVSDANTVSMEVLLMLLLRARNAQALYSLFFFPVQKFEKIPRL